ncbi:hypothetical protein ACQ661_03100 [Pseudidiomarina sp. WS423]|uniref:hypothetical protein n=1 Tax=Pseudidiomarina sp. WS423 TaxID=3425124 RepID=UPI003D6E9496
MMAVKHSPPSGNLILHQEQKGGKTGCGIDTKVNPSHWSNTHDKITCDKNGCKN